MINDAISPTIRRVNDQGFISSGILAISQARDRGRSILRRT